MIFNRKPIFYFVLICLSVCVLQSCIPENKFLFVFNRTSVKHPPKDSTAFVFGNRINIEPHVVAKDEQNRLETELENYWDDTIRARTIQQFGLFYRIKTPQRFDTIGLTRSMVFMNSFLQSQGYYNAVLNAKADTTYFLRNSKPATLLIGGITGGAVGTLLSKNQPATGGAIGTGIGAALGYGVGAFIDRNKRTQVRVTATMNIHPGKRLRFDSISYNLVDTVSAPNDSLLQQLAVQVQDKSLLKPGNYYSKQILGAELDRLVAWYRQNGLYKLSREKLAVLVDTTDQLIDSLIIDPFELARKTAEAAEKRRQNPTADITISQATQLKDMPYDSAAIKQYYIGRVFYYPETSPVAIIDTLLAKNQFRSRPNNGTSNVVVKYTDEAPLYRMRPFLRHTYITRGELYNEKLFYKTINSFGQMGPWQQVDVRDSIINDSIDFHIFLTPTKRYTIKTEFELTRSTGDFASSSNLFGVGGNLSYLDRNFLRRANQLTTFARGGVELNLNGTRSELVQTIQLGTGLTWVVPHLEFQKLWSFWGVKEKQLDAARTVLNINGSYTERKEFFRVRSLIMNAGWELRKDNSGFSLRFPNIELYSLDTLPKLSDAFNTNPFLRTAFNTGSVLSIIGTWNKTVASVNNPNLSHFRRVGFEYSGFGLPAFFPGLKDNIYHYLKGEFEYIAKWQYLKKAFVLRGYVGAGFNLINDPKYGKSLPFFKQFVAGGPNSMRAWGLRQLGLGSSLLSETATGFKDRFGDFQLEGNAEYRFLLADLGSARFSSALFADIGNIWNLKKDPANPLAQFKPRNLYNDLAIALGAGLLRLDVANFILRVDFGLKLKDPVRKQNNGWLDFSKFSWKNQYGNNNYAFQIGIGLPF